MIVIKRRQIGAAINTKACLVTDFEECICCYDRNSKKKIFNGVVVRVEYEQLLKKKAKQCKIVGDFHFGQANNKTTKDISKICNFKSHPH